MTELRDTPVFIAGHPKSGTSLLRSVFDSHPELITYPEETNFFQRYLPKITGCNLQEKLELSDRYLTQIFEWNTQNSPPHQAGYPDRDYSAYPVDKIRQNVRENVAEKFRHDGDMLSSVILAFGKVSGQLTDLSHYWVEKTPYNEYYAAQIFKWWPDARIVHTIRDPRDNYFSYHRKHADWSPESFALNWVKSTQAGLNNYELYGSDRYLLLRFEDLTKNPEAKLTELCKFLKISDDPSLRHPVRGGKPWGGNSMFADQFTSISAAPVGRWRKSLKPDEVATIELVAGPVMTHFGYSLATKAAELDRPTRLIIIRRLLSLTLASHTNQDLAIIQATFREISDLPETTSTRIDKEKPLYKWQLFIRLASLLIKETFS
jgi:Sulfotransferase family